MAVLGWHGFGAFPLYSPEHAQASRQERTNLGLPPTPLEARRGELLDALRRDEAFEILHFVPLYLHGAGREEAMDALASVASAWGRAPELSARTRLGGSVVAAALPTDGQRRTLGLLVEALQAEWERVVGPRREQSAAERQRLLSDLATLWSEHWALPLGDFLRHEGLKEGTVLIAGALGREGRFLGQDPSSAGRVLLAVGLRTSADLDGALGSVVRELCYPAVRRALAPFESRFADRVDATRASDLVATRCGELLLEAHAPDRLPAYRARFGIAAQGPGVGFLTASGMVPGVAAWEGALDEALRRELNVVSR
jgi:hypothetical protein